MRGKRVVTDLKSARKSGGNRQRPGKPPARREPLEVGRRLFDTVADREGEIVEFACQYAHPQAPPTYAYLIRWQDGQIQALAEAALRPGQGIELLD